MKKTAMIFIFFFLFTDLTFSDSNGYGLAKKVFSRDRGDSSLAISQMVLVNSSGKKRVRFFKVKRLLKNGLERQLIRFESPADIKGTSFLTIERDGYATDQFLYLPALRRSRRIVSSQKSQRFVNSDFTYEDMERHPVEDYSYKIIGEKKINRWDCFVLESKPLKTTESQYHRVISLIHKDSFTPLLIKFFDKKNKHIKTFKVLELKPVGGIVTEMISVMEDHKKKHKTYLKTMKINYNLGFTENDISRKVMELN